MGAGGARVVAARAHAAVQIKNLPQRHVEGADAPAHRRCQRTLDGDPVGLDRREGVLRQVLIGAVKLAGFITGINLEPLDVALAAVGLGDGRIQHPLGGWPDVHTGAVAADEGDDRVAGHHRLAVLEANCAAAYGGGELLVGGHGVAGRRHSRQSLCLRTGAEGLQGSARGQIDVFAIAAGSFGAVAATKLSMGGVFSAGWFL